jgi:tetratricopeptide (TPR) repeat protein
MLRNAKYLCKIKIRKLFILRSTLFIAEFKMKEAKNEMDAYVEARSYEREAREEEKKGSYEAAIALWKSYAELKESKGSYFLCMYGHFNAARVCDKVQRWKEAADFFEAASTLAERIGERSLWAFFMNMACQMHEKAGDYDACKDRYEAIGNFFYALDNFFVAADAYEHAAEIMALAGEDISDYEVPVNAWHRNYEYWKEQGEMDDAEWSLKRIDSYRTLQSKG